MSGSSSITESEQNTSDLFEYEAVFVKDRKCLGETYEVLERDGVSKGIH